MSVKPNQLCWIVPVQLRNAQISLNDGVAHTLSQWDSQTLDRTHSALCISTVFFFALILYFLFFTWLSLLIFRICTQIYRCFLFPRFLSSETPFFTLNPLIFRCSFPRFPVTSLLNYSSFRRTYLDVAKLIKSILMLERFHFYEWKNRCFLL